MEENQPNAQAAHIHSSTKFEPTNYVPANFLTTEVLTNPIPQHVYIGRTQGFPRTAVVVTMARSTAIIENKFLSVDFSSLFYFKKVVVFRGDQFNSLVRFMAWIKDGNIFSWISKEATLTYIYWMKTSGVEDANVVEMDNARLQIFVIFRASSFVIFHWSSKMTSVIPWYA